MCLKSTLSFFSDLCTILTLSVNFSRKEYIIFKSHYHASRFKKTRENLQSILKYLKAWICFIVKKYFSFARYMIHERHASFISVQDTVEWSVSRLSRCRVPLEKVTLYPLKKIRLGSRAGPDNFEKKCPLTPVSKRTIIPRSCSP